MYKQIIKRLMKRNHELYKKCKIQERLNLCLIREEDNAHQRNIKAVEYIDKKLMKEKGIRILDVNWNKFKSKEDIENFIDIINQGIAILVEE